MCGQSRPMGITCSAQCGQGHSQLSVKTARPVASFFRKSGSGKLLEDAAKAGTKKTLTIER